MGTSNVQFVVHGTPAPQGSKTRMPNGAMLDGKSPAARARFKDWRNDCSAAARAIVDAGTPCFDEPLIVQAEFRFPMPKSRRATDRAAGTICKATAPDLDKLQRALGDSLTAGGLLRDDALIAEWRVCKVEVWQQWTGVAVVIKPWGLCRE